MDGGPAAILYDQTLYKPCSPWLMDSGRDPLQVTTQTLLARLLGHEVFDSSCVMLIISSPTAKKVLLSSKLSLTYG